MKTDKNQFVNMPFHTHALSAVADRLNEIEQKLDLHLSQQKNGISNGIEWNGLPSGTYRVIDGKLMKIEDLPTKPKKPEGRFIKEKDLKRGR